jgi:hypothetical protein
MLFMRLRHWARVALLVAVTASQMACLPIREATTGRDIECSAAPEADCLQAVDFAEWLLAQGTMGRQGQLTRVAATASNCDASVAPGSVRCWGVTFEYEDGGVSFAFIEQVDGTFKQFGSGSWSN